VVLAKSGLDSCLRARIRNLKEGGYIRGVTFEEGEPTGSHGAERKWGNTGGGGGLGKRVFLVEIQGWRSASIRWIGDPRAWGDPAAALFRGLGHRRSGGVLTLGAIRGEVAGYAGHHGP